MGPKIWIQIHDMGPRSKGSNPVQTRRGLQERGSVKRTPRMHPNSVFGLPHINGKLMTRPIYPPKLSSFGQTLGMAAPLARARPCGHRFSPSSACCFQPILQGRCHLGLGPTDVEEAALRSVWEHSREEYSLEQIQTPPSTSPINRGPHLSHFNNHKSKELHYYI